MKINMKLRWKNNVTLTAIVLAVIALVYQVIGLFGAVLSVDQSDVVTTAGMVINVLVLLGIVVDPTTDGAGDSDQAITYKEPRK